MANDHAAAAASGPGSDTPPGPSDSWAAASGLRPEAPDPLALPPQLAEAAHTFFADRLALATAYAEIVATDGVVRGLIGPREAPRIWDRHVLNCAAVAELVPTGSAMIDVGSGAGLPGIVLAIARPDISVVLIEPLARRTSFLTEVVTRLGLDQSVTVVRGRVEEYVATAGGPSLADVVTARAVGPLDRLAGWCLPLTAVGGRLLALKGASAADEVAEHRETVSRLGGGAPVVRRCGVGLIEPPTTVVEIVRKRVVQGRAARVAGRPAGRGSRAHESSSSSERTRGSSRRR